MSCTLSDIECIICTIRFTQESKSNVGMCQNFKLKVPLLSSKSLKHSKHTTLPNVSTDLCHDPVLLIGANPAIKCCVWVM